MENTSVYAGKDARGKVVLVAINKSDQARPVAIKLKNCRTGRRVAVFRLTSASASPVPEGDLTVADGTIAAELPAQSVSTLVIKAPAKK